MLLLKLFFATHLLFSAEIVSMSVAKVENDVLTSRDVLISHYISLAIQNKKISELKLKSESFRSAVSSTLLETVVFKEAKALETSFVSGSEIAASVQRSRPKLQAYSFWRNLDVSQAELAEQMEKKLKAQAFIQFKANSSIIPITDTEALNYFKANQNRFSGLEFDAFKDQIKKYLSKQQMDERLKSWFRTLREKYSVNNMLGEWDQK